MNSSGLFLNSASVNSTPIRPRSCGEGWEGSNEKYSHLLSEASTPNSSTASTPVRPRTLLLNSHLRTLTILAPTPSPLELRPIYEAESPDEIALVETAFSYNCRLLRRSPDSIVISMPGKMFVIN